MDTPSSSFCADDTHKRALCSIADPLLPRFDRLIRTYVVLNTALFLAMGVEVVLLLVFFTFLAKSALLAFGLALFFLTVFSFFILRLYYQTAKPEELKQIVNQFIENYKTICRYHDDQPEHAVALANACTGLSEQLAGKECLYYPPPPRLVFLTPFLEKFSAFWHWQDVHKMRELLLQSSIEQHLHMVRLEPTNLEIHAALANAHLRLAELYASSLKENHRFPFDKYGQELPQKYLTTCEKAIEEFKIVRIYAPNDPWAHVQLAYVYRDLNRPMEEIAEYETLAELNPNDQEVLYKLGSLYFEQGMNAKGLRIYDELRKNNFKKVDTLIQMYGRKKK